MINSCAVTPSGFCPGKKKKYTVKGNNGVSSDNEDDAYTRNTPAQKKEN